MKNISESLKAYFIFIIIIVLVVFSSRAKQGAIEGINLCEGIIIPSLLPVLILTNTIVKMRSGRLTAVLFGLISGYPSGAVLTKELYNSGNITSREAQKIMSYNFCGGFAFIISVVGGIVYKSTKAGILLYISCVLPCVIIALITNLFNKNEIKEKPEIPKTTLSNALCESVESSVKSLALMSAYIIMFSALLKLLRLPSFLIPLLEITNGICNNQLLPPVEICAFYLSFGGLCVHFQLFPFLKEMKIGYFHFLIFRLLSASLSYFICKAFLYFFPDIAAASASLSPALPFEISKLGGGLSMIMVIGCAVVIFDLENRKTVHSA